LIYPHTTTKPDVYNPPTKSREREHSYARRLWPFSNGSLTPTSNSRRSSLAIEKQKEQVRKLQSYKPRVTFDSLTIATRPLGVKLCSNDGRYLEIVEVDKGGAGDEAGILPGDLIVQINDDCFESAQEGLSMVKNYPLPLELHVRRIIDNSFLVEDAGASSTATGGSSTVPDERPSRDSSQFSVLETTASKAANLQNLTPRSRE